MLFICVNWESSLRIWYFIPRWLIMCVYLYIIILLQKKTLLHKVYLFYRKQIIAIIYHLELLPRISLDVIIIQWAILWIILHYAPKKTFNNTSIINHLGIKSINLSIFFFPLFISLSPSPNQYIQSFLQWPIQLT